MLITLSVPPAASAHLTDWLLEQNLPGFSSWNGWGHGDRTEHLSVSEQIQGKQNRTFISLHLPQQQCETLLEQLHQAFEGFDIHYWISPVVKAGRLG
ncbi:MAG: DUF3240 family protein [Oceanobacter sp.]